MAKKSTNITIDEQLKKDAKKLFADLGMDLSTAINIFLRQAVREKGIPFEVSAKVPNNVTVAAITDAENGADCIGPFDSVESLMESLNA